MSDDEADPELLELLRESLGLKKKPQINEVSSDTGVLKDAEYIYSNAIDVLIDMWGTKGAAALISKSMQERNYSTESWGHHELHPTREQGFSDLDIVNFVFTMDLLNFSFWSELSEIERYQVEYQGRRWTGYKSLLACLRRALDEGVPITTPSFWYDQTTSDDALRHVFRSATDENMPLLAQRVAMLRDAGMELTESFGDPDITSGESAGDEGYQRSVSSVGAEDTAMGGDNDQKLNDPPTQAMEALRVDDRDDAGTPVEHSTNTDESERAEDEAEIEPFHPTSEDTPLQASRAPAEPDKSILRLIEKANDSAGRLVNLLAKHFPSFRDETRFDGRKVRLMKRAQIFVADLWAAFNGKDYGAFDDIDHLTMFADYRVPQMLHSLGVLVYSPPLDNAIRTQQELSAGHSWEVQLRGCSIWAVELIRQEIVRQDPCASTTYVNAVLIDFFLYDLAKEREAAGHRPLPHHRTRSIWY